jgi:hypothetical protein
MRFLWLTAGVALGIALATVKVDGHTCWQHTQKAWSQYASPAVNDAEEHLVNAVGDAKDRLTRSTTPHEHHSKNDRAALNKLIARRAATK